MRQLKRASALNKTPVTPIMGGGSEPSITIATDLPNDKSREYVQNVLNHSGLSSDFVPQMIEDDYDWILDPNDYTDKKSALIRMEKKEMLDLLLDMHSPKRVWVTVGHRFLSMFFDVNCDKPNKFQMYIGLRADRWSLVGVCSGPKDEPYTKNMFLKHQ